MADDKKTLDAVIEAAFEAGVAFGAGYPAREAIPEGVAEDAYRRWRDTWTGLPHEHHDEPSREALVATRQYEAARQEQPWP